MPRINGNVLSHYIESKKISDLSKSWQELVKNENLLISILNAPDGVKEVELINKYIGQYHPEYFRGYQCIKSEYCPKNIVNEKERLISLLLDISPEDAVDDFQLD